MVIASHSTCWFSKILLRRLIQIAQLYLWAVWCMWHCLLLWVSTVSSERTVFICITSCVPHSDWDSFWMREATEEEFAEHLQVSRWTRWPQIQVFSRENKRRWCIHKFSNFVPVYLHVFVAAYVIWLYVDGAFASHCIFCSLVFKVHARTWVSVYKNLDFYFEAWFLKLA